MEKIISRFFKSKVIPKIISIVAFIGCIIILEELLFPRIKVNGMQEEFEYKEFMEKDINLSSSLFVPKKETIWNINGYDFTKGKDHGGFPIIIGQNTLKITNGDLEKTYVFDIKESQGYSLAISDERLKINSDYLDYDGDGISNIKEKEVGLATYTNDTDEDGLLDNVELAMGLDPNKKDKFNEVREYKISQDNSKKKDNYLVVKGKGNIANTFLDSAELNMGFNEEFIKSDVVRISTSNTTKPENMTLYLKKSRNMSEEDHIIYSYNENEEKLEALQTTTSGDYMLANIDFFDSLCFIGNKSLAPTGEYKNQIMILLDNSGSMYSTEYVGEKLNKEITIDLDDYGKDIHFKRISLMEALVDRLGSEKYEYSVYAFTGTYYNIIEDSKEIDKIKEGINTLKTEHQEFNGTELSGAIRKYVKNFENDVLGKKYMIVLTDGEDSGWFTYKLYDSELSRYKKQGINIITIGLGDGIDSDYLMDIATKTGGKYLYASDANMLEDLIKLIESGIKNQETDNIDGDEVTLIADSGFEVARDGFSFSNFGSVDSPDGNCYGFSRMAKDIYLNKFKDSAEAQTNWLDKNLVEYKLTPNNKERIVKGNVYNIKLNDVYEQLLDLIFEDNEDYYSHLGEDNILYINEKYKNDVIDTGFEPFIKKLKDDKTTTKNVNGKEITTNKYECIRVNCDNEEAPEEYYKDDYQLLQLINRNYRIQFHHLLDLFNDNYIKKMQGKSYDYEKEVKLMMNEIKAGSPALISINCEQGGHSVLATKVYKTNDLEKYFIGIYDSNIPGRESRFVLERQTSYESGNESSYYSFKYEDEVYSNYKWSQMIYAGTY